MRSPSRSVRAPARPSAAATSTVALVALVVAAAPAPCHAQAAERPPVQVRAVAEAGFLGVGSNFVESGVAPTRLDFREAAGQDSLSFVTRWSAELDLGRRTTFVLLYQPLTTEGTFVPSSDVRVEGQTFRAGVPMDTRFAFPFYRASWLYRVWDGERTELQLGLTGQIRNARYTYEQGGLAYAKSQDIGFVPALKARGAWWFAERAFAAFEADGIYAPISVLNGSTNDTVGAILDASLRAGVRVHDQAVTFLGVRYLGGGATSGDPGTADYTKNWLHTCFVTLGASLDLVAPKPQLPPAPPVVVSETPASR